MMRAMPRTCLRLAAIAATSICAVGQDTAIFKGPVFRHLSKWHPAEAALADAHSRRDADDGQLFNLDSRSESMEGALQTPMSPGGFVEPPGGESLISGSMTSFVLWLVIAVSFALFAMWGAQDLWHIRCFWMPEDKVTSRPISRSTSRTTRFAEKSPGAASNYGTNGFAEQSLPHGGLHRPQWSTLGLVALTSYRFYTGFLSATWIPYLLAMEGQDLWAEKQSVFMGMAKLIYGTSILLNPLFGLIGDSVAGVAHFAGRRLFVRCGLVVAFVGIVICVIAEGKHALVTYMVGLLIWRIGEAINDVTTEALVPEIVPREQFELASSVKSFLFFLGGLFGYVLIIFMVNVHFTWLYYAYPIMMLVCSMPALILLEHEDTGVPATAVLDEDEDHKAISNHEDSLIVNHTPAMDMSKDLLDMMKAAYLSPMLYDGGFPFACLSVFIFSLGTSPMFFLLLIVRDLVGIHDSQNLQREFSFSSIVFFLMAAVAAVLSARRPATGANPNLEDAMWKRGRSLLISLVVFSLVVLVLPIISLFSNLQVRNAVFYLLSSIFGFAFGSAFSRFQDLVWQVLPPPPEGDVGNAMGFNVMSRLFGVGLGNFIAGWILDCFFIAGSTVPQSKSSHYVAAVYSPRGYFVMCLFSACCSFAGTFFAWLAMRRGLPKKAVPAPAA